MIIACDVAGGAAKPCTDCYAKVMREMRLITRIPSLWQLTSNWRICKLPYSGAQSMPVTIALIGCPDLAREHELES